MEKLPSHLCIRPQRVGHLRHLLTSSPRTTAKHPQLTPTPPLPDPTTNATNTHYIDGVFGSHCRRFAVLEQCLDKGPILEVGFFYPLIRPCLDRGSKIGGRRCEGRAKVSTNNGVHRQDSYMSEDIVHK